MQRFVLRAVPRGYPYRRFIWGLVLLMLASLGGMSLWAWQGLWFSTGGERLGDFGIVPDFSLVERHGQRITLGDFQGLVWVANFIYTTCSDTCPMQSVKLARLQRDFANARDVRLVSISVAPEHDTPEVLQHYAQRFGADPERWFFLTGDKTTIFRLAQEGFHLSVVNPEGGLPQAPDTTPARERSKAHGHSQSRHQPVHSPPHASTLLAFLQWMVPGDARAHAGATHEPLLHSARFVLVDRRARIRGYYHSDEEDALRRLRRDVRTVLRESWAPQR